jgi:uncharacterized protein (DUF427 family)
MRLARPTPDPIGPGQESVWDYPRPPALVPSTERIQVLLAGIQIARTDASFRVLETSHPPAYYLPPTAFIDGAVRPAQGSSFCEWKGSATYFDLVASGQVASRAAWSYPAPTSRFSAIAGWVSLYPGLVDEVLVDGERVQPQAGGFYGGWITSRVVGPFKGEPGSAGW